MNNQTRNLIFGTLIGAAMGLASAFLLNRRAQETGTELRMSTGDGMKLGVMIIGLLRGIAALGEEK